jgi:sorbitol/mannitol transport system substrate-binding protein
MTLRSINAADPNNPTVEPVPYVGIQFVAIPEWAGIGTSAGQEFSAMVAGQLTPEQALARAQALVTDEMEAAGY